MNKYIILIIMLLFAQNIKAKENMEKTQQLNNILEILHNREKNTTDNLIHIATESELKRINLIPYKLSTNLMFKVFRYSIDNYTLRADRKNKILVAKITILTSGDTQFEIFDENLASPTIFLMQNSLDKYNALPITIYNQSSDGYTTKEIYYVSQKSNFYISAIKRYLENSKYFVEEE